MPVLDDLAVGVMFWAAGDPQARIHEVKSLGVRCGQLGIPGDYDVLNVAPLWNDALEAEQFILATVFCAYNGESYADIPTVQQTVGFVPPATRDERVARTLEVSDFAREIGVRSIACHIGFVPHDPQHPDYQAMLDVVRRVCDHAAKNRQTFALETGQEPAEVLLQFMGDVGRPNLAINFDPANMILYGTGDPIQALEVLGRHVVSVHCKDGNWPPKDAPAALGTETPLGEGAVGIDLFVAKLKQIGYRGILSIERETDDPEKKRADLRAAVALLQRLRM